ncbi:MAG TPA: SDR family oxidoreductase [Gemmatimonadota bacterium]|nr:SDR family oxidoreductase [Gemmatimonadota bacterium]
MTDRRDGPCLVTGVTGFVGGHLALRMLAQGYRVAGMTRSGVDPGLRDAGLEVRRADALADEGLDDALTGVRDAFYLIHAMGGAGGDFAERDATAARNFLAAAERQGVRRIIYLGGLGESDTDLSAHLASRHQVGEILASGSPLTTILRAAVIIGPGSASTAMLHDLVRRLPVMIAPRWVTQRIQPIYIGDVLAYLIGCLEDDSTAGHVYDIGGPDVLTYAEMMREYGRVIGRRPVILTVPLLTPRLSSYWVDLVTSVDKGVAHALIEGLRNEVVVRDPSIRARIPFDPTPFRVAVAATLDGIVDRKEALGRPWPEIPFGGATLLDSVKSERELNLPRQERPEPGGAAISFLELRAIRVRASTEVVFQRLCRIGGREGWYALDWAWGLRGALDRMVGGPGLRRNVQRRHVPQPGDALDCWQVVRIRAPRDLVLEAEMKLPGRAWLGFHVRPGGAAESLLFQRVVFFPRDMPGRLYWWGLYPMHHRVFRGMLQNLASAIEHQERSSLPPEGP